MRCLCVTEDIGRRVCGPRRGIRSFSIICLLWKYSVDTEHERWLVTAGLLRVRQADKVKALVEAGVQRVQVQEQLGISKASYYRCLSG